MTTTTQQDIDLLITHYDEQVRRNATPTWDTVKLVAECDEGIYGAFGEVLDIAADMGLNVHADDMVDALEEAFTAYQARLKTEVAAR